MQTVTIFPISFANTFTRAMKTLAGWRLGGSSLETPELFIVSLHGAHQFHFLVEPYYFRILESCDS